mmetsp:Transcript_73421/g.195140  ORF Transcript_73421/g.195140 Transcript_73421/m.195140 type:complete len:163 (+) Transcript_73421:2-490(+)
MTHPLAAKEGPRLLSAALSSSTSAADKVAAVNELWKLKCPEVVQAIKAFAANPPDGLNLYTMARELPIEVLMRAQFCSEESIKLFRDEAGIATASELVRYCGEGDDVATELSSDQLAMLALETENALPMNELRQLVLDARGLCDSTSRISLGEVAREAVETE